MRHVSCVSLILVSMSVLPIFGRVSLHERMVDAVGQTDIALLQKLMKKFNRDHLSTFEKKKALEQVQARCLDVIHETENPSILSSWKDSAACLCGALMGVYGLSYLQYYGDLFSNSPAQGDRSWLLAKCVTAAGVTCLGFYNVFNGVRTKYQRQMHETALKIEDYLENCVRELDMPSKEAIL